MTARPASHHSTNGRGSCPTRLTSVRFTVSPGEVEKMKKKSSLVQLLLLRQTEHTGSHRPQLSPPKEEVRSPVRRSGFISFPFLYVVPMADSSNVVLYHSS